MPDETPTDTTELDWRHRARDYGWALLDGHWQHPDRDVVHDDTDRVYLSNGHWEDADVATWTPEQRRAFPAQLGCQCSRRPRPESLDSLWIEQVFYYDACTPRPTGPGRGALSHGPCDA